MARYGLHSMAGVDAQLTELLHAQFEKAAAITPQPPEVQRFWYSPEFRAGMMLAGIWDAGGISAGVIDGWRGRGWIYADAAEGVGLVAVAPRMRTGSHILNSQASVSRLAPMLLFGYFFCRVQKGAKGR